MKIEYYTILGIEPLSDAATIQRAYRQQALRLHPDKNRADPLAAEKFRALADAYAILSDSESKAKYDTKFLAEKERQIRLTQLDARRLAMRQDLLAREKSAVSGSTGETLFDAGAQFQAELERTRRRQQRAQFKPSKQDDFESSTPETTQTVQIKWAGGTAVSIDSLERIFSRYGPIHKISILSSSLASLETDSETCIRIVEDLCSPWRQIYSVSLEAEPAQPPPPPKRRTLFSTLMAETPLDEYEKLTFERLIAPRRP